MSEETPEPLPPGTQAAATSADQPSAVHMRLDPLTMTVTIGNITLALTLASQNLLAYARTLATETKGEYHQMAVLFAHGACDLHTEWAMRRLIDARPDKTLGKLVVPEDTAMSLDTDRIRRVYRALTGDNPTEAGWWKEWEASRQDRHDVAHRGRPMTRERAENAIALADQYIAHVTVKVEAALKSPL